MPDKIHVLQNHIDDEIRIAKVTDDCPFSTIATSCSLTSIECLYGLTEVTVPKDCPLRLGPVATMVRLNQLVPEKP